MKTKLKQSKIKSPYFNKTMSKTATFTIGERLAALKIFDQFKGSISALSTLMDDVKQFPVTKEEWDTEGVNLIKTPVKGADGQDNENWVWQDGVINKEITLQTDSVDYLLGEIRKKSDAGEITLADTALISIQKKLV